MRIYLIDYENIKDISVINELSEKDIAIIFYSKNSNSLTFEAHQELSTSHAKIEYKSVDVGGKNALDFQLSTYLGFLIKEHEKTDLKITIVSKDNGFSYLKLFWEKEKNISIELLGNISESAKQKEIEETPLNLEEALKQSKLRLTNDDVKIIMKTISQFKTKQAINNGLMKHFRDSDKVGAITKTIKPYIKNKK